jgi:hypothetical protein
VNWLVRVVSSLTIAVGCGLLSGCGGSSGADVDGSRHTSAEALTSRPPSAVVAAVLKDTQTLSFVHVDMTLRDQGTFTRQSLDLSRDGRCKWNLQIGQAKATVAQKDGRSFLSGNAAYWALNIQRGHRFPRSDMWVKASPEIVAHCSLDTWLKTLAVIETSSPQKSEATSIEGEPAVKVTFKEPDTGTIWVALDSPHRLLRWDGAGGAQASWHLTHFDDEFDVTLPDPSKILGGS